jgi:hypothetical protein
MHQELDFLGYDDLSVVMRLGAVFPVCRAIVTTSHLGRQMGHVGLAGGLGLVGLVGCLG